MNKPEVILTTPSAFASDPASVRPKNARIFWILITTITFGLCGCEAPPSTSDLAQSQSTLHTQRVPQSTPNDSSTERLGLSLPEIRVISIFKRSSPSVVHITAVSLMRSRFDFSLHEQEEGTGTGFIWDQRGHIVTNYHVIRAGNAVQVALTPPPSDQGVQPERIFDARLIGVAPDRDLAVLKIDAPESMLNPLPRGRSHQLSVGQYVLAIGNPFGFDQTLTTGVISGLGREIQSVTRRPIKGVIQTDAAINPGNSGGPLINSSGEVIGVNTAIFSPSGAYAGIGFAVPIDTVNRVVPQLIAYGREVRPSLGLEFEEGRRSRRYRLPGALILRVLPQSEAARAGLKGVRWGRRGLIWGDFIISINGQRTPDAESVYQSLDEFKVGDQVTLEVQRGLGRGRKRYEVKLKLGQGVTHTP